MNLKTEVLGAHEPWRPPIHSGIKKALPFHLRPQEDLGGDRTVQLDHWLSYRDLLTPNVRASTRPSTMVCRPPQQQRVKADSSLARGRTL